MMQGSFLKGQKLQPRLWKYGLALSCLRGRFKHWGMRIKVWEDAGWNRERLRYRDALSKNWDIKEVSEVSEGVI